MARFKKDKVKNFNDEFIDTDIIDDWTIIPEIQESSFIPIDRDKEDADVIKFQKTGDLKIIESLYVNRVQTLEIWASRYHYLSGSSEDMFSELIQVFMKAVSGYSGGERMCNVNGKKVRKTTPFNTYLWYSIVNYIRNLKSGARAKKRRAIGYEGPLSSMVLSLDSPYTDKNGSEKTLKDIIAKDIAFSTGKNDKVNLKETLKAISSGDKVIFNFLTKLCNGHSLASAIKDSKTVTGRIRLNKSQVKKFQGTRKYSRIISNLISEKHNVKDKFKLIKYEVNKSYLNYAIEMHKTEEMDLVMRTIRVLKKNKSYYMKKISK